MAGENKKCILVVEDDQSLSRIIKMRLNDFGYDPIMADNAEKAIEVLKEKKPDLIWLDIYLPGMNGFDFLEIMHGNPETKDIKVAIVSVSSSNEKLELAAKFNITDYFIKSNYGIDELVGAVTGVLNRV